eukprot:2870314-Pleurochrysis_carterae.AAC.4
MTSVDVELHAQIGRSSPLADTVRARLKLVLGDLCAARRAVNRARSAHQQEPACVVQTCRLNQHCRLERAIAQVTDRSPIGDESMPTPIDSEGRAPPTSDSTDELKRKVSLKLTLAS